MKTFHKLSFLAALILGAGVFGASAQSNVYKIGSEPLVLGPGGHTSFVLVADSPSATTPAQKSDIPARPEALKYPSLNYEPPAPEQFRVKLKSGPVACVYPTTNCRW